MGGGEGIGGSIEWGGSLVFEPLVGLGRLIFR